MKVACFLVDITPSIGKPMAYGTNTRIHSRQYVRGVVIDDGKNRAVLAAADVIAIGGSAYDYWCKRIGETAGCSPESVLLHAVHQHDAVFVVPEADDERRALGWDDGSTSDDWRILGDKIAIKIEKCLHSHAWKKASVSVSEQRMSGAGSNRRLLSADGKLRTTRWSMCHDPEIQSEPVGLMDPLLRTIGFVDASGTTIASLHFYASHPMVAYRRNQAGSDVPGRALSLLSRRVPGHHIWFTGCAGDITFGRYTSSDPLRSLSIIGRRFADAMENNIRHLNERHHHCIQIRSATLRLPLPKDKNTLERLTAELANSSRPLDFLPALRLACWKNRSTWGNPAIRHLTIAKDVHILSFPSEMVVWYQLFAQSVLPEQFVACAALGNYQHGYICTDKMFKEGGYEPSTSLIQHGVQSVIESAITQLLSPSGKKNQ